jgi:hypothetical protein
MAAETPDPLNQLVEGIKLMGAASGALAGLKIAGAGIILAVEGLADTFNADESLKPELLAAYEALNEAKEAVERAYTFVGTRMSVEFGVDFDPSE